MFVGSYSDAEFNTNHNCKHYNDTPVFARLITLQHKQCSFVILAHTSRYKENLQYTNIAQIIINSHAHSQLLYIIVEYIISKWTLELP